MKHKVLKPFIKKQIMLCIEELTLKRGRAISNREAANYIKFNSIFIPIGDIDA